MLDRQSNTVPFPSVRRPAEIEIGLPHLLAFLRRERWIIAGTVLAFFCLGAIYLVLAPKQYAASTTIMIDPSKVAIFATGSVLQDAQITNSGVETESQVLSSGKIARAVVDKLKLDQDPVFMSGGAKSPVARVKGWISGTLNRIFIGKPPANGGGAVPPDRKTIASQILLGNLLVSRVGLSYAINVQYTDTDPYKAARIANAVAQAYLADQVQSQVDAAQHASNWLDGRLRDLQAKVQDPTLSAQEKSALRATYDTFLQRYTQTVQQQSLPFADAQILTAAVPPPQATSPKALLIVLASIVGGGMVGFGIAVARELLDKTVKTSTQVETATDAPFLGFLPTFDMSRRALRRGEKKMKKLADPTTMRFSPGPAYSIVLTAPFSRYAETLRSIRIAAETGAKGRAGVLGIVSAVPNEGRSTLAVNLARLIAAEGQRPLLIDGDMRNPALSRSLIPAGSPGLAEVITGRVRISEVIWSDEATSLQFLPAGADIESGQSTAMLTAAATKAVINACRHQYDVVIIDLPATTPVVDVRAAAHLFDAFVMVTAWGRTDEDMLRWAVRASGIEERIIGTVLNRVNMRRLAGFENGHQSAMPVGNYLRRYSHIA
jgi:succinoglycan biosynthesis transport protein ExoP